MRHRKFASDDAGGPAPPRKEDPQSELVSAFTGCNLPISYEFNNGSVITFVEDGGEELRGLTPYVDIWCDCEECDPENFPEVPKQ